jgi:hypothetical protein
MTHEECEWLSDCCGAEPMEGAVCSQCRDTSGFSCEDHPIGEDYILNEVKE